MSLGISFLPYSYSRSIQVGSYVRRWVRTKRNYAQGSELSENRNSAPAAEDNVPEQAERCLSSVRGKLSNDLSVEYTVNELIQEARDFKNLACIFHGQSSSPANSCVVLTNLKLLTDGRMVAGWSAYL